MSSKAMAALVESLTKLPGASVTLDPMSAF